MRAVAGLLLVLATACETGPVRFADPTVRGTRSKAEVRAAFEARADDLRACFEDPQVRDAQRLGSVTVRVTIAPGGAVTDAEEADGASPSPRVRDCVLSVARTLVLPEPSSAFTVAEQRVTYRP